MCSVCVYAYDCVCVCMCVSTLDREKVLWQDGEEGVSLGDTVPQRANLFTSGRARGSWRKGETPPLKMYKYKYKFKSHLQTDLSFELMLLTYK